LRALHTGVEVDVAHLAGLEYCLGRLVRVHDADLAHNVLELGGEGTYGISRSHLAIKYAHQQDNALIYIVPRIDEEHAERLLQVADWSGYLLNDGRQERCHIQASLG